MKTYILFILGILLLPLAGFAQSIGISIPDSSATEGETVVMPVVIDSSLDEHNVLSYQLEINYNSYYARIDSIETSGTLSDGWSVTANTQNTDKLTVGGAGSSALTGTGTLLYMYVKVRRGGTAYLSFSGTDDNFLNEGTPELTFNNGQISITALPELSISPSSALITRGDQKQYSVSGGTSPYSWSLTDPTVASIDTNGLLTGENPGLTEVIATDAEGISDTTSGSLEVRGFKLFSVDTSEYQGQTIDLPIHVSDLSGLDIKSGAFDLRYNQSQFEIAEITTGGTILPTSADVSWSDGEYNRARIAFAGSETVSGKGVLIYVRFNISPDYSGYHSIYFDNILFNEDLPGNHESRTFRVLSLPDLSVSPSSAEMLKGDSLQFSATNSTGSTTWTVSDTTNAKIDIDGWLYALKGGSVTVTSTDSLGATGSSNQIKIYDFLASMPDTSANIGDTVAIPVNIENLPAVQAINSVEGTFLFNQNLMDIIGISANQSLTDGWSYSYTVENGVLKFAGAGSNSVNANGDLFYFTTVMDDGLTSQSSGGLYLQDLMVNEGTPIGTTDNGSITIYVTLQAPTLESPTDGANGVSLKPFFDWSVSSGVSYSQLQLSEDNTFATTILDTTNLSSSDLQLTDELTEETTYYWRVRVYSQSGVSSDWSTSSSFTTVQFTNSAPYVVQPIEDITVSEDFNSFALANLDTVFAEPDVSNGDSLTYEYSLSNELIQASHNHTSQSYTLNLTSQPDSNGSTVIYLKATDTYGASAYDTVNVTIQPVNDQPLVAMPDDTLRFNNDTTLVLNVWDYVSDVETSDDQLSYQFPSSKTEVTAGYDATTGELTIAAPGYLGSARIAAAVTDTDNATSRDTLIVEATALSAPVPDTPTNGDTLFAQQPTFNWTLSSNTTTVQFQLADTDSFTSLIVDTSDVTGTSLQIDSKLSKGSTYFWRLRGFNDSGSESPWSDVFRFTIQENHSPYVHTPIPDIMLQEDFTSFNAVGLDTIFIDPDLANTGDTLSWEISQSNNKIRTEINKDSLHYQLVLSSEPDSNGTTQLIVKATDITGAFSADTVNITVNPVNDAPVVTMPGDTLQFKNDSSVTVNIWDNVIDIETSDNQLTYKFTSSDTKVSTSFNASSGVLTIEAPDFIGMALIDVTVTDPESASVLDTLVIDVEGATSIDSEDLPIAYDLGYNYPNPFNPTTAIRYSLPEATHVRLVVYNLNGQPVATLVNGQQKRGRYQISFNARNFSSGIYFYRLQTKSFQQVRKMTLLK